MTINLKCLSTVAAGVVLTATVGVATPSLARDVFDIGKTIYHNNGSVTVKTKVKTSAGTVKVSQTTDKNGNAGPIKTHIHNK